MAVRTIAAILREIDGVERGVRNKHIDKAQGAEVVAELRREIAELARQQVLPLAPPEPPAAAPTSVPPGKRG